MQNNDNQQKAAKSDQNENGKMNQEELELEGLRITKEQVMDVYMEGTIDGYIEKIDEDRKGIKSEGEKTEKEGFQE